MKIEKAIIDKVQSIEVPLIVGVSGLGGAGKSTFASSLGSALDVPVIGVDSFMKDRTLTYYSLWEVMDFKRLEKEVLLPFLVGKNPIQYGHFDWGRNAIKKQRRINHQGRIIIEGVGLFRPELLRYFGYKIWVNCPIEKAISRGKKRDRKANQSSQDEYWDGIWKKNDQEYLDVFKPMEIADVVIDNC